VQGSLLARGDPGVDASFRRLTRIELSPTSWIEVAPEWLRAPDVVFDALVAGLAWHQYRRPMYERIVDEPRLTAHFGAGEPAPLPVLDEARAVLAQRYGEALDTTGFNYYRDGHDSVAWHGDRIGRNRTEALVVIVSVGRRRPFRLRPKGGGPSQRFALGDGDLFVMGGACQREFEHCVPKVAHAEPRISITYRTGSEYAAGEARWPPYRVLASSSDVSAGGGSSAPGEVDEAGDSGAADAAG
jgi:alkylated DNA repair dioxygenase AlkB